MKKKIPDPLDNHYNYDALLTMYTEISDLNADMADLAYKHIQDYIKSKEDEGSIGAIKAIGLSIRLETDSEFRRQMIEAKLQHEAVICSFVLNEDVFFDDYLFPRICFLSQRDFKDTLEYRLHLLSAFSFEQYSKNLAQSLSLSVNESDKELAELIFDQSVVDKGVSRIALMKNHFLTKQEGQDHE